MGICVRSRCTFIAVEIEIDCNYEEGEKCWQLMSFVVVAKDSQPLYVADDEDEDDDDYAEVDDEVTADADYLSRWSRWYWLAGFWGAVTAPVFLTETEMWMISRCFAMVLNGFTGARLFLEWLLKFRKICGNPLSPGTCYYSYCYITPVQLFIQPSIHPLSIHSSQSSFIP